MSSATTPTFKTERVGAWADPVEFPVERERIKQYAAATNDAIAQHAAGEIAPPVFAIVPAFGAAMAAAAQVIPPELVGAILHGEQDFRYHRPIVPETTLVTRARVVGVHPRSSGVTVTALAESRDAASDELVAEQYMVTFVRGAQTDEAVGEEPPNHRFDEALRGSDPVAEVSQTFDADQTFRYSEASGDPMPIHLDDAFAKSVGLPGIIIHGLCTMAFTSRAVIERACPDDPTRLKRLAVRFSKIVQPKQTITTRIWSAGERDGRASLAYETTSDTGDVVIKDGLAEVGEE